MRRLTFARLLSFVAPTLAGVVFTLPCAAYRTAGETPDFEGTSRVRWAREQVSFVLHTEGQPNGVSGGVSDVLLDAMRQWNEPLCSSLELQPAGVTSNPPVAGDGVNTIAWVRDWSERGFSADAPATTDVQYGRDIITDEDGEEEVGEWRILEADLYLDARRSWTLRPAAATSSAGASPADGDGDGDGEDPEVNASVETFDLLSVLTHELGHAAGLMHPCEPGGEGGAPICGSGSSYEGLTMFPLYAPDQATLEQDDERGVCFLYEQDTCEQTGCETGFTCVDQRCEALCGSEVCELGQTCVDDECVAECTSLECLNPTCKRNKDCPATLRCDGKYCVPGLGELGDPCATPRDCASQACSNGGVCLLSCTENTDCPEGEKCRSGENGSRVCTTDLGALGDKCTESNECLGDQCIADAVETPVCTRRCGEGESECPLDWTCDLVEGRAVCIPPAKPAGGCGIAKTNAENSPRPSGLQNVLPWTLLVLLNLRARRGAKCARRDKEIEA